MKNFNKILIICCILLMIFVCFLFIIVDKNKENTKLNNQLISIEQELSNNQNEITALNNSLQTEINNNKNMEETISNLEEMISDLTLELSIANEKIANMQDSGVPVYFTDEEVTYIAKTVYGEARGSSKIQQSAVVWCILNRLDNGYWGSSIKSVVTAKGQFHGYSKSFPVTDEIKELVEDVLMRWTMEKMGVQNVGRTLPKQFLYFSSDKTGLGNVFKTGYHSGDTWNWDCWNPYK